MLFVFRSVRLFLTLSLGVVSGVVHAADVPQITRILPPPGIEITAEQRDKLTEQLDQFKYRDLVSSTGLPASALRPTAQPAVAKNQTTAKAPDDLMADVVIYYKAVRYALDHGEFYKPADVDGAFELLKIAAARANEVKLNMPFWTKQTGLVVRGYQSEIDNSYQPYGLVIPDKLDLTKPAPLYVWLHGRNDKGTDLQFILERQKNRGEFTPDDGIVLHPLGRYCNAFKFAGERDVLEAIASVQSRYKIDPRRIVMMGFSMGGAGAWHLGAHYPSRWVAMQAGAGFVDTRLYQNLKGDSLPAPHEQQLWHLYDVPSYTRNLFNIPVISYSGEEDKQKASADIMEAEYEKHGEKLHRIIGAKMGHKYDAPSKTQIVKELQAAHSSAIKPHDKFTFQTRTLRYNQAYWVELLGLERHWDDTRVEGEFKHTANGGWDAKLTTNNVTALRIHPLRSGPYVVAAPRERKVMIDDQTVVLASKYGLQDKPPNPRPIEAFDLILRDGKWQQGMLALTAASGGPKGELDLRKLPGLQGPIDDAFMDGPVLFVSPSGKSPNPKVNAWVDHEMQHQRDRWRRLFRGDMPTKKDTEVTADDIARCNLVLWGDSTSNALLSKINAKLPVRWSNNIDNNDRTSPGIQVGKQSHDAKHHMLAMIYPNPLNPMKYVVLNSGPTFRETHDKSNATQTAKLPDWAVIDLDTPPSGTAPGRIVDAGFFDEQWKYVTTESRRRGAE